MDIIGIIAGGLFCFGYFLIALERKFSTNKSAIALMMAGILWMLAAIQAHGSKHLTEVADKTAVDVFGVVAFTLASMALIEILVHYHFFDWVRLQLLRLHLNDRAQFALMIGITFMISGVLDNISLTIAMIQVARRFFSGKNLLIVACAIVIASNGGGAWSPVGDVTSLLLWLSGKVTAWELISTAFLPTVGLVATAGFLLYRQLDPKDFLPHKISEEKIVFSLSEKVVIASALFSFVLPLIVNTFGVPPYLGRLFGLGFTWACIEFARTKSHTRHKSHLTANIEMLVQKIDIASVEFIMGILLSVGALTSIGVLAYISQVAVGTHPSEAWVITLGSLLGLMSGIVDNSALMAISLKVFPITDPALWGLISITTGTGGSLLIFASAAGIVAMGSLKELTFQQYLKIGSFPALAGLIVGVCIWFIQNRLIL
jgi:Na+/H+ antiporter NhaD/arsenite permease-like protein